ncbi:MAG: peptidoglycan DD-metalloendopeptidase family protein [Candidatus Azobacteroides sp.]|nr:peptidoglycan DD-metalloendopeptidase family protein [Candidatus Azobacteroides sp.]
MKNVNIKIQWFIFFLWFPCTLAAQSDRTQEIEIQKNALLTEIDNTSKLLNENKKTTKSIQGRLSIITQQIGARKQLIGVLEKEMTLLNDNIQVKEQQIQALEKKLQQKKRNYIVAVRKIYEHKNNQDQLLFILSANNLVQSFRRTLYLKKYVDWSKQQADEIAVQQSAIVAEKEALNAQKREKERLAASRKTEELQLEKEENSKKTEIADLQKDAQKMQDEIAVKKKQMAALNREIDRIISENVAASRKAAIAQPEVVRKAETTGGYLMTKEEQSLSSSFAQNKGKLPFPVRGSYKIISHFGQQQYFGLKNRVVSNSNGIEIETTRGNVAKAVFEGEVTAIVLVPGLQTSVFIKHGNYYTFYSYLEQVYVKKGDKVKTGQDIGKIFSDDSTVLYFELRKDMEKINPEPWLAK